MKEKGPTLDQKWEMNGFRNCKVEKLDIFCHYFVPDAEWIEFNKVKTDVNQLVLQCKLTYWFLDVWNIGLVS